MLKCLSSLLWYHFYLDSVKSPSLSSCSSLSQLSLGVHSEHFLTERDFTPFHNLKTSVTPIIHRRKYPKPPGAFLFPYLSKCKNIYYPGSFCMLKDTCRSLPLKAYKHLYANLICTYILLGNIHVIHICYYINAPNKQMNETAGSTRTKATEQYISRFPTSKDMYL